MADPRSQSLATKAEMISQNSGKFPADGRIGHEPDCGSVLPAETRKVTTWAGNVYQNVLGMHWPSRSELI